MQPMSWGWRAVIALVSFGGSLGGLPMLAGFGQAIAPDGTLNTTVTSPNALDFTITNGTAAGGNLFHSFQQFGVPTGGSATFDLVNTPTISTLFSRVTGGSPSSIDGLIRTINGSSAVNLFLLNPNGILLGPNAQLNIGGSFVGTTAHGIQFADGREFRATNPTAAPLLTISVPIGLQFGGGNGSIQVQGNGNDGIVPTTNLGLVAAPATTIALVGGDVQLAGGVMTAPVGRIEVGAVDRGTVSLTPTPAGWQLGYGQVQDFRDIALTARSALWNPDPVGNPFGGIQAVGRDIRLDQSQIAAATAGAGAGGAIAITAQRALSLGGVNPNAGAPSAWIVNQVAPGAAGRGGAVAIQAGQVTLEDGAAIETLSFGPGAAGAIRVEAGAIVARGSVALPSLLAILGSSPSRIASSTYGAGATGDITVAAQTLTFTDSALLSTLVFPGATGPGGNITVAASEAIAAQGVSPLSLISSGIGTYTFGRGRGGNIAVTTGDLRLAQGGGVFTGSSRLVGIPDTGLGPAGNVSVIARQTIDMRGADPIAPALSSFLGSITTSGGNAGQVLVTTPSLTLREGASLGSNTFSVAGRFGDPSQSSPLGNAGNVTLNVADRIEVTGSNLFTQAFSNLSTNTSGSGNAGNMLVNTRQLILRDGGWVTSVTSSTGNAGSLTIYAQDILVEGGSGQPSSILASAPLSNEIIRKFYGFPDFPTGNTGQLSLFADRLTVRDGGFVGVQHEGTGNAGRLEIQANRVTLDHGQINASTAFGQGGELNLRVQDLLVLRNGSQITATANGNGNGGNITIQAPVIVGAENSDIIANAGAGRGGNIQIFTQGIFGLKFRTQLTPSNDITATGSVNGTVEITPPNIDLNSGLLQLPITLLDPSQTISGGCTVHPDSSFVITGRGGLPLNPQTQIGSDRPWTDTRNLAGLATAARVLPPPVVSPVLVEATAWHRRSDGTLEAIADPLLAPFTAPFPATCAFSPPGP